MSIINYTNSTVTGMGSVPCRRIFGKFSLFSARHNAVPCLAAIVFLLLCLACPSLGADGVKRGLEVCVRAVIPSLFPFLVLCRVLMGCGFFDLLGYSLSRPVGFLFRMNGQAGAAVIIGLLSGFPLGAKCAVDLYTAGELSDREAERLLGFCNNTGPAFLISGVGSIMFGSAAIGVVLYVSQLISAVLCGVLFGIIKGGDRTAAVGKKPRPLPHFGFTGFSAAVSDSVSPMLSVCAFVVFFSAVQSLASGLIGNGAVGILFSGFLEIGSSLNLVAQLCGAGRDGLLLAALFTGWSGLSVHMQVCAIVGGRLKLRYYFAGKLLSAILTAVFSLIIFGLL